MSAIVQQGADYVLALKDNHVLLHGEVRDFCHWCQGQPGGLQALADDFVGDKNWGHGRAEVRRCYALAATPQDWPDALRQWPQLKSIVAVQSSRSASSRQWRFYLSSLPSDATLLLDVVRSHWQVENNS